jgi:hypothetical protein
MLQTLGARKLRIMGIWEGKGKGGIKALQVIEVGHGAENEVIDASLLISG